MATAKGSRFSLLMGEESAWGTAAGTFTKVPVSTIGGSWFRQNLVDNPEIRGNRNPQAPVLGNKMVNGNFGCPLHLDAIGWILKHGVGVPATSGSGTYTHVGKVNFSGATENGDLPAGMTFEHQFPDLSTPVYHVYTGCKVSSLGCSVSPEGVAVFDVNVIGKDIDHDNAASLDSDPIEYTSVAQSHFNGTIQEGGSPIAYVQSVNFTLDNGLDDTQYTFGGAGALSELSENVASLTGQVTALFQSNALLAKAVAKTESSLQLKWTDGSYSLTLDFPELYFEAAAPTVSGDRGVLITLPFRAFYADNADKTILKYTLVNTVSAYSAIASS